MNNIIDTFAELIKFTGITVQLTLTGVVFGILLGLLLAIGRLSKNPIARGASWVYIWIFRGTPLLMQLFFIYFGLPMIKFTIFATTIQFPTIDKMQAGLLALGLNSAAYLAEIIRAAILSIDKGQMEAAKALGMSYTQAMRRIIIPQSYRRLIPPVGNEIIMLLKDTALVSSIGLTELLRRSKQIVNNTSDAGIFLYTAAIYLFLTTLLTYLFQKLEERYSIYE